MILHRSCWLYKRHAQFSIIKQSQIVVSSIKLLLTQLQKTTKSPFNMFKLLAIFSIIAIAYAAPGVVVAPVVHHAPLVPVGHVSHSVVHPAPVVRHIVPVKTIVPVIKPVVAVHPVPVVKTIVPVHHPAVLVHH
ncbi:uncharacterized protein LOC129939584 [Eupeodes corollae]|uniref:uncharacterized protein LOC129939584 n=1 Tax=Eupeodes corollae TaxID=290404 RepID=UPI00249369B1|nr:uncharacterized protein LOC129939584 [Eupeodes corollae]